MIDTEWFLDKLDKVAEERDKEGFKALVSDFDKNWTSKEVDADKVNNRIKEVRGRLNVPAPELEDLMSKRAKRKYLNEVR